jgi:hypothetical protein
MRKPHQSGSTPVYYDHAPSQRYESRLSLVGCML